MTQPLDAATTTPADEPPKRPGRLRRPKAPGFRSADVLRTAALVIGMYLSIQLVRFAHPLFLTAFLGVLFGLAVSAGVDRLTQWRMPRGVSAALIVISFFALLVGFGAWMAPTLHTQGVELRRRLPDAIDRVESWVNAHRGGMLGMVFSGLSTEARVDSAATTQPTRPPVPAAGGAVTPGAPATPGVTSATGATPTQSVPAADSAKGGGSLRDRMGTQLSGATRYLFPFLSSTLQVVTGFLLIVFLSIYIAVDPAMYHRGLMVLFPRGHRQRAGEV